MLAAFTNAGFAAFEVHVEDLKSGGSFIGFVGLATAGMVATQDSYTGARAAVLGAVQDAAICCQLIEFFNRCETFSLCCGEVGVEFLLACNVVGNPSKQVTMKGTNGLFKRDIELERNRSSVYESRWVNIRIPEFTGSILLRPITDTILPCWIQGTYLGFKFLRDQLDSRLLNSPAVAATFYDNRADEGFAITYPRNPTEISFLAGICSFNGRHTALLFDPSLSYHTPQWQYVPEAVRPLRTSPWALIFQGAYLWARARVA